MPITAADDKPRRARKKSEPRRWVREAKGISALVVAEFAMVALITFDAQQQPADQHGLVGPVGAWLAWALFRGFGYASVLFPLLLGGWGAAAFLKASAVRGRLP